MTNNEESFIVQTDSDIEQSEFWAQTFTTSLDIIAEFVDISLQTLHNDECYREAKVQTRLANIRSVLIRTRCWFNSEQEVWDWLTSQQLVAFGYLTPSEVVKQFGDEGILTLSEWITERKTGGFQ